MRVSLRTALRRGLEAHAPHIRSVSRCGANEPRQAAVGGRNDWMSRPGQVGVKLCYCHSGLIGMVGEVMRVYTPSQYEWGTLGIFPVCRGRCDGIDNLHGGGV